jgi:hypothetical protein
MDWLPRRWGCILPAGGENMPRKVTDGCQGVYLDMPIAVKAAMEELARKNHRSLQAEIVHASKRHLEVPPVVHVLVVAERLPEVTVEHQPQKLGRPKKAKIVGAD